MPVMLEAVSNTGKDMTLSVSDKQNQFRFAAKCQTFIAKPAVE